MVVVMNEDIYLIMYIYLLSSSDFTVKLSLDKLDELTKKCRGESKVRLGSYFRLQYNNNNININKLFSCKTLGLAQCLVSTWVAESTFGLTLSIFPIVIFTYV